MIETLPDEDGNGVSTDRLADLCLALVETFGINRLILLDVLPLSAQMRLNFTSIGGGRAQYTQCSVRNFPLSSQSWLLHTRGWVDASFFGAYSADPLMHSLRYQHMLVVPVKDHAADVMGVILLLIDKDKSAVDERLLQEHAAQLGFLYGYLLLEEHYRESRELFNDAAEFAHLGFWYRNTDADVVFWSAETYRIFGEEPFSFQPTIEGYYSYLHPEDVDAMKQAEMDSYAERKRLSIDHRIIRRDGVERWVHLRGQISWSDDDLPLRFFGIVQDITEQKNTQLQFRQASLTDYLTDLGNRRGFIEQLRLKIAQSRAAETGFYVTYIDLDYFKEINDIHGHEAGDTLLNQFGNRLLGLAIAEQYIARIGGDEFAIIHSDALPITETLDTLTQAIVRPFTVDGIELQLSVSMGSARFPEDAADPESLMARADDAMFAAKRSGRNCSLLFDRLMHEESERRGLIREGIKRLEKDASPLYLVYQPIVDHLTQTPEYFEVLARWDDPELGFVSPGEFIPIAEETGLISLLSRLIVEKALQDMQRYRHLLPSQFRFSINLSSQELTLESGGLSLLLAHIQRQPELARHLVIEITETAFLSNEHAIKERLESVQSLAVPIALDDFGTGYSSLTHVREYPIQILKIDKSFIQDYLSNPSSRNIVDTVVYMAKTMHLKVVAEGVESGEVAEILQQQIDWLQGYYISKPAPLGALLSLPDGQQE